MRAIQSHVSILTNQEIEKIHNASLEILEEMGIFIPHETFLRRLEKMGAVVDYTKMTVRFPKRIIIEMIEQIRKESTLPTEGTPVRQLKGHISTSIFINDYRTKTKRYGKLDDIKKGICLVRFLPNIGSCNAVCVPSDVNPALSDLYGFALVYQYADREGGTYVLSPRTANYILDITEIMGQTGSYLFETVSPLKVRRETLEIALIYAERGHDLSIAPMIVGGTTGPVTMAGMMTMINAEVLGSLFCCRTITGRIPNVYCHGSHLSDPKTMLCSFGSPIQSLIGVATTQMANFYGMEAINNVALTDALKPDFQAGFEKAISAVMSGLSGSVGLGCQGLVGADQGFSFEQLILDNEWLDYYNFILRGFDVNDEKIGLDAIFAAGIGGNFISEEHTAIHFRDSYWHSEIFGRESWDAWLNNGGREIEERAHEVFERLISGYTAMEPAVPEDVFRRIDAVVYDAERMQ